MTRNAMRFVFVPMLSLGAILIAGDQPANAQQPQPAITRKALLQQDSSIPGYQATVNIVEIPAGVSEIRHTHPGPLSVYVLEGTLILEYEGHPTTTYNVGGAVLIEAGKVHRGINNGTVPVKLLATLVAEKGKPPSSPAP